MFDGTDGMYFHGGGRGYHWMWDSRCFNYGGYKEAALCRVDGVGISAWVRYGCHWMQDSCSWMDESSCCY